jgi:hypothetical protein
MPQIFAYRGSENELGRFHPLPRRFLWAEPPCREDLARNSIVRRRRVSGTRTINAAERRAGRPRERVHAERLFVKHGGVAGRVDSGPRDIDIPLARAIDAVWA